MAKWGEGDPRWVVEERPDATNVNNWNWTEKNACQWSKEKLKELLVGLKLDNKIGKCKITEVRRSDGDASANSRKAKIIVFFEWELQLKWTAKVPGEEKSIEGTVEVPNLSDENSVDDLDIQFLTENTSKAALLMKEALRAEGTKVMKDALQNYIDALKREFLLEDFLLQLKALEVAKKEIEKREEKAEELEATMRQKALILEELYADLKEDRRLLEEERQKMFEREEKQAQEVIALKKKMKRLEDSNFSVAIQRF